MSLAIKDWSEIVKNVLEGLAICGAAVWALFRFGLFRERYAKIEFNLDCRYLGKSNHCRLVELIAVIENKGLVRQYIKEWTFDLLLLDDSTMIDETDSTINYQVKFFNKKISKRPWVPASWYTTFIDAGTRQVYTYLTAVPENTKFITLYSRFIYPSSNDFHSSQKTFELDYLVRQKEIQ